MQVHPWNEPIRARLAAGRARSAHAWLLAGPAGVGKTRCALAFARHLLGADGDERAGALFEAGTHPDMHVLARDADAEDSEALEHLYARRHLDERAKGTKPKTVITVGQVRRLIQAMSTCAHSGARKVALVLDAHLMNINAANALLKMLEEPPEGTVLVLVSDRVHRLPATVRSRCTMESFDVPARGQGRAWLAECVGADAPLDVALDLAGGAPLEAARLIAGGRIERRGEWLDGVAALCDGRADTARVAEVGRQAGLADALAWLQKLLVDLARCRLNAPPERRFNSDREQWLQKQAQRLQLENTLELIDAIGRMRQDVDGPLDATLLLEDTLNRARRAVTGAD